MAALKTNNWLWLVTSIAVFIALGFWDPFAGTLSGGNPAPLAVVVNYLMRGVALPDNGMALVILLTIIMGGVAIVAGWILQAGCVVVVRNLKRNDPP